MLATAAGHLGLECVLLLVLAEIDRDIAAISKWLARTAKGRAAS